MEAVPDPNVEFVRTRVVEELKTNQEAESRYRLAVKEPQRVERERNKFLSRKKRKVYVLFEMRIPNFRR
jgi:hypothetical protein